MQPTRVECYAGASYPERPRAFTWQGELYNVKEILTRWKDPSGPGFRVRTERGEIFLLQYSTQDDVWKGAQDCAGRPNTAVKE